MVRALFLLPIVQDDFLNLAEAELKSLKSLHLKLIVAFFHELAFVKVVVIFGPWFPAYKAEMASAHALNMIAASLVIGVLSALLDHHIAVRAHSGVRSQPVVLGFCDFEPLLHDIAR